VEGEVFLAHISRKELRKDEVRETLAHGAEAVLSHQQLTMYVVIVVVVVALGFFSWKTYSERQNVRASAAFDDAMTDFQARVPAPGESAQPGEHTYTDDKTKYTDASKKFADVALKYPRTRTGQLAKYYEALSMERLDKNEEAKKLLQEVADSGDSEFAALSRFELAGLHDRTDKPDDAVKLYRQLLTKPTILVPKPLILLALGEHYSAKNPAEAAKYLKQISSEYPGTPIAQQATQELALLPGQS
jgi:predicted negative regulator of RcsB-dependent stress response